MSEDNREDNRAGNRAADRAAESFIEAVADFIDAGRLLGRADAVVLGVSGGADSVALLAVMRALADQPQRAYRLTVAHLNHQIRPEADADEAFVAELAEKWDVPVVIGRRDVPAEARRAGEGIEQAARRLRYEFLAGAAAEVRADRVAVAHHADDNVETILHRIVRGTHLRGLAGVPARRPLGVGGTLIRPLLGCRRSQVEDFCRRRGLSWRTDATNADTAYSRNFIRHELLPLLRTRLNARADEALLRLAAAAGQVTAELSERAGRLLERATVEQDDCRIVMAQAPMRSGTPVIRAYAMRLAMERVSVPLRAIGQERLAAAAAMAVGDGRGELALPGRFRLRRAGGEIVIEKATAVPADTDAVTSLECPGRTDLPDGRVVSCSITPIEPDALAEHCKAHKVGVELLDLDKLCGGLTCRLRRKGDSFVPLGLAGRQTVGDFLTNLKLPDRMRREVLCVRDELGIVYLAPLRIDDRVKVSSATRRVLRIELAAGRDA